VGRWTLPGPCALGRRSFDDITVACYGPPLHHVAMCANVRGEPAQWVRDLEAKTKGRVRVQLSPDIGVDFPVEIFDEHGPGYVDPEDLGLSGQLADDVARWQMWWGNHVSGDGDEVIGGTDEEWRAWSVERDRLCSRLREELGSRYDVRSV
jgi:hypothetical protein